MFFGANAASDIKVGWFFSLSLLLVLVLLLLHIMCQLLLIYTAAELTVFFDKELEFFTGLKHVITSKQR